MTEKGNKKPRISDTLASDEIQGLGSANADQHRDRITRFGTLKHRSKQQENFLWTLAEFDKDTPSDNSLKAVKSAHKLNGCGNYLLFKNFYTIDQIKLAKFHSCGQHLLCPFCAGIRASRAIQKYTERIDQVLAENRKLKPVLITFTVKNGEDLTERFNHLMDAFKTLLQRRRDYLKKNWGFNEFCKISGAMYSYENTYNEKTNEWHPHLHMFALLDDWIDQEKLSQTWFDLTGDSFVVDVRRVKKSKEQGYAKAAAEVCKYALKFGDLSVQRTWDAFLVLKGRRLSGAFGSLWGVKIPEVLIDDMPDDNDLQYLEMLYKFVFGKGKKSKSYYNLVAVKQIEPQAKIERMSDEDEGRGPTERMSDIEQGAKTDLRGTDGTHARARSVRTTVPQRVRKHWQVSPYVRVRTRTRIRKWQINWICLRMKFFIAG